MAIWIIVIALFIVLLIMLEEGGHYILNQYLFGSKNGKQLKLKISMMTRFTFFKKKLQTVMNETNKEKRSFGKLISLSRDLKKVLSGFIVKALIKPVRMIKRGYFLRGVKTTKKDDVIRFINKYLKGFSITRVIKKSNNNRL